jgi:hypothetical protein
MNMNDREFLYNELKALFENPSDTDSESLYVQLNQLRDWINQNLPDFELYLEDVWNEKVWGETHFEYILRSRKTFNELPPIGYDIYKNHQDTKGVWHLDEYVSTVRLLQDPQVLVTFIEANR